MFLGCTGFPASLVLIVLTVPKQVPQAPGPCGGFAVLLHARAQTSPQRATVKIKGDFYGPRVATVQRQSVSISGAVPVQGG